MWQLSVAKFFQLIQKAISRPWSDFISEARLYKKFQSIAKWPDSLPESEDNDA